jgi:hypothetical protein
MEEGVGHVGFIVGRVKVFMNYRLRIIRILKIHSTMQPFDLSQGIVFDHGLILKKVTFASVIAKFTLFFRMQSQI